MRTDGDSQNRSKRVANGDLPLPNPVDAPTLPKIM